MAYAGHGPHQRDHNGNLSPQAQEIRRQNNVRECNKGCVESLRASIEQTRSRIARKKWKAQRKTAAASRRRNRDR